MHRDHRSDQSGCCLAAKPAGTERNANTGKLKLTFKRPSQIYPALGLTESLEVTALASSDKPGASDRLMLWISGPVISTTDKSAGPKLSLSEEAAGDEEGGDPKDDNGSVDALANEFKGQRWTSTDRSSSFVALSKGHNPPARPIQPFQNDAVTR